MKVYLVLLLTFCFTSLFSATVEMSEERKRYFKSDFLEIFDEKFGSGESYRAKDDLDILQHILASAEDVYLDGSVSLEGYNAIKCKVNELLNLEKIIAERKIPATQECMLESFSRTTCLKDATLEDYYSLTRLYSDGFVSSQSESNQTLNYEASRVRLYIQQEKICNLEGFAMRDVGTMEVPKYIQDASGTNVKLTENYEFWKLIYSKFVDFALVQIKNHPGSTKKVKENATVSACDPGLKKDADKRNFQGGQCKNARLECSEHGDCCSGVCEKDSLGSAKGTCAERVTCYKPIALGQQCGDILNDGYDNKFCIKGACMKIDYNSGGVNALKANGKTCSSNVECSSNSCKSNKCVEQYKCMDCAGNGEKPSSSKMCCPGFRKSLKGKCTPDFPPLVLPVVKSGVKFLKTIFANLIPLAYAEEELPKCTGIEGNNLSQADEASYQAQLNACEEGPEPAKEACLLAASQWRASRQSVDDSGKKNCSWSADDYKDAYNSIAVTAKTYSDVTACEFNSYNDTWRDMSNAQRNAELVVRGFEYVYTGKGTKDYWIDSSGRSIFSRAQEVAKKLRISRTKYINKMKETDIEMACQCIAIFGPQAFSAEKQAFFNSPSCEAHRSSMANMNIGNTDNAATAEAAAGGISDGQISEVDTGASGISHGKILVEWLRIKFENQMARFVENAKVEKDILALSDQLDSQEWKKSKLVPKRLYQYKAYRGRWSKRQIWFRNQASNFTRIISELDRGDGLHLKMFLGIWGEPDAGYNYLNGYIEDRELGGWRARGRWFRQYKDVDRYYHYPYYVNNSPQYGGVSASNLEEGSEACKVYGQSSSCLKNVYKTKFQGEDRYMLDIKKPLFVDYASSDLDHKYVKKINEGFERGKNHLIANKPGGQRRVSYSRIYPLTNPSSGAKSGFKLNLTTGGAFLLGGPAAANIANNQLNKKNLRGGLRGGVDLVKQMLPDGGDFKPKEFDNKTTSTISNHPQARKSKFLKGAMKFAQCKDLVECGADGEEYREQLGFGELFESEEEAKLFANYVYEHHFHWPSLTDSDFIGYPLMAQRTYFEIIAHNIRLVGSLAAGQGAGYGDAYFKYKTDWDKRKSLYDSAGNAKQGDGTKNVKYSKQFLSTLNMLDFSTGDGVAALDSSYKDLLAANSLNSYEKAALSAASGSGKNAFSSRKKFDLYKKQTEGDPRAGLKEKAQVEHLNRMSTPLSSSGLKVGGTDLGNTGDMYKNGGGLTSNAISKALSSSERRKNNSRKSYASIDRSQHVAPRYNSPTSFGGLEIDDEDTGSSDKNIKASGMGQSEIKRMLRASRKDKSLKSTEDDNVFTAVSKAYKRNYNIFFHRKSHDMPEISPSKKEEMDSGEKSKLKKLLGN